MGLVLCAAIPDSHRKVFYEERRESRSRGGPNGQETVFTKRAIVHSASAKKKNMGKQMLSTRCEKGSSTVHGSGRRVKLATRDRPSCVCAKPGFLAERSHGSWDDLRSPHPVTDWRVICRVKQGRTSFTSLGEVRFHLIDYCPVVY